MKRTMKEKLEAAMLQHILGVLWSVPAEVHFRRGIDFISYNGFIELDNGERYRITVTKVGEPAEVNR